MIKSILKPVQILQRNIYLQKDDTRLEAKEFQSNIKVSKKNFNKINSIPFEK